MESVPRKGFSCQVRWCVIFCLLCIFLAELAIGRSDLVWHAFRSSSLSTLYNLEEQVIRTSSNPAVVIFGTSRARDNFLPTILEQELGLARGQVLNLAMGGADVFDPLVTYERNRDVLRQAEVVIIQIDGYQFSVGRDPMADQRFRKLAGWSDRLAYSGRRRWNLVRDAVFQLDNETMALHQNVKYHLKRFIEHGQSPKPLGVDQFGRLALTALTDHRSVDNFRESQFQYWIDFFYKDYDYSKVFEGHLVKLVTMAREDGATVYIVQLPMAGNYLDLLKQYEDNPYGQFRTNVPRALQGLEARMYFWERPEEMSLTDQDFRDWGHLGTSGAKKMSVFIANMLKEDKRHAVNN